MYEASFRKELMVLTEEGIYGLTFGVCFVVILRDDLNLLKPLYVCVDVISLLRIQGRNTQKLVFRKRERRLGLIFSSAR